MSEPSSRLSGILVPLLVPLDDRGRIAEDELTRYVGWLIDHGVHGLYPNGSTGEFTRFTSEERRRIVSIVCTAAAGRVPVIAGAADANVTETLRACEHAASCGAVAVSIVAPHYFRLGPESVYAYYHEIGRQSPIDVTLYNIPVFASQIDVDTVRRLAEECPRVVGIKDSSGDISHVLRMVQKVRPVRPDFAILTGWDTALVPMLVGGCDGGVHSSAAIAPELTRGAYDAVRAGDLTKALTFQTHIADLLETVNSGVEFPENIRVAVAQRGIRVGPSRQPATTGQLAERERYAGRVRERLAALGLA
jgi:dihydrodipicolinate synthase/N-acetylneuraminate lyase